MRLLARLALCVAFCLPAAFGQSAAAQATPASPCKGTDVFVTVRVSEITPQGSPEKFKAAVAAHLAWYRTHGFKTNQIVIGQLVDYNESTNTTTYINKKFITYHINPPDPALTKHDAAWDAYVKLYSETSKLLDTYRTCMPETVISTDPIPWMKM